MYPAKSHWPPQGVSPFLRWAGSKRKLLPQLLPFWDQSYLRYVEPFAGSACLFFRLLPKKAILGDINQELIGTYLEVKHRHSEVLSQIQKLRKGRKRFLELREKDPNVLSGPERAARFIYLNRFCFNGLYRTNLKGQFNVPYGGDKSGSLPTLGAFKKWASALKGAKLISGDFERVLAKVEKGDFVYMDPPFSTRSRRVFKEYSPIIFGEEDIKRLRVWMLLLANKGIDFVTSFAECDEGEYLSQGFYVRRVSVVRNIAGFTKNRFNSTELLISLRQPTK